MTISLESERLMLRPLESADRPALYKLIQSPDILIMLLKPHEVFTDEWFEAYFERLMDSSSKQRQRWAIVSRSRNCFVGLLSLVLEEPDSHAEIGYWVGSDFRGEGIATDACRLLIGHCFEALRLHRVFAFTYPYNTSSIRVLEKLGMQKEGVMREHVHLKGRFWDMWLYGILRDEFLETDGKSEKA